MSKPLVPTLEDLLESSEGESQALEGGLKKGRTAPALPPRLRSRLRSNNSGTDGNKLPSGGYYSSIPEEWLEKLGYVFAKSFHLLQKLNALSQIGTSGEPLIDFTTANPVPKTDSLQPSPASTPSLSSFFNAPVTTTLQVAGLQFTPSESLGYEKPSSGLARSVSDQRPTDYTRLTGDVLRSIADYAKEFLGIPEGDIHAIFVDHGVINMYRNIMSQMSMLGHKSSLVFTPTFGYLFTLLGDLHMNDTQVFQTRLEDNWEITLNSAVQIAEFLKKDPPIKSMVFNFPNNPTGKLMTKEMVSNILRAIVTSGRTDKICIFSDELLSSIVLTGKENFSMGAINEVIKEDEFKNHTFNLEIYTAVSFSKVVSASDRFSFMIKTRIQHNCEHVPQEPDINHIQVSSPSSETLAKLSKAMMDFVSQKKAETSAHFGSSSSSPSYSYNLEEYKMACEKRISVVFEHAGKLNENLNIHLRSNNPQHINFLCVRPCMPASGNVILLDFSGLKAKIPQLNDADNIVEFLFHNCGIVMTSGGAFCSDDLLNKPMVRMVLHRSPETIKIAFERMGRAIAAAIEHGLNPDLTIKPDSKASTFRVSRVDIPPSSQLGSV